MRVKLLGSAGLLIGFMAVVGLVAIGKLSSVAHTSDRSYRGATVPLARLGEARALINENRVFGVRYIVDPGSREAMAAKIDANTAIVKRDMAQAAPLLQDAADRRQVAAIQASLTAFRTARQEAFARADAGSGDAYAWWVAHAVPVVQKAVDGYTKLFASVVAQSERDNGEIHNAYNSGRRTVIVVLLAALLAGALVSVLIARGIRRNVALILDRLGSLRDNCATDLEHGLGALRDGDLTVSVQAVTPPIDRFS
ncbi:MAG TPA: MCP four helix bundle domain-containing protein, partial [Baekduia sp.]|nr:MCP four helix bundle domain-containing protein [Baekduia sp.]